MGGVVTGRCGHGLVVMGRCSHGVVSSWGDVSIGHWLMWSWFGVGMGLVMGIGMVMELVSSWVGSCGHWVAWSWGSVVLSL